ncbi:SDR family NAD(P)-dependent oxidoreductase [Thermodesulfobacteriota bacterium]
MADAFKERKSLEQYAKETGMRRFAGKVAIVTASAGAGIGQATVRRLASEGANVVINDIHERRIEDFSKAVAADYGVETLGIVCDASQKDQVENVVKQTLDKWGRIDILVNNAARNIPEPIWEMKDETWDIVIKVCIYGTMYFTRAVLPTMIKQKYGRIVGLSSGGAWIGCADGQSHYCPSKAFVASFMRCVGAEVAPLGDITCNAVAPGAIWNPFHTRIYGEKAAEEWVKGVPLGWLGYPEEVAAMIAYFCSDDARWLTGETMGIAGGAYMHH